jgi:hypothetical protein
MVDITDEYIKGTHTLKGFSDNYEVHVTWRYNSEIYKYYFTHESNIEFPPYTLETLRRPVTKIVAASVDSESSEYEYECIKQYAGPRHNFYGDCGGRMDISRILGKSASTIDIINSKGEFKTISGKVLST